MSFFLLLITDTFAATPMYNLRTTRRISIDYFETMRKERSRKHTLIDTWLSRILDLIPDLQIDSFAFQCGFFLSEMSWFSRMKSVRILLYQKINYFYLMISSLFLLEKESLIKLLISSFYQSPTSTCPHFSFYHLLLLPW